MGDTFKVPKVKSFSIKFVIHDLPWFQSQSNYSGKVGKLL